MRPLLIDVSQFVMATRASGIQRVLQMITHHCDIPAWFGALFDGEYHLISRSEFQTLVDGVFMTELPPPNLVNEFKCLSMASVGAKAVVDTRTKVLFPELTYHRDSLRVWQDILSECPECVSAIFYDALPEINPQKLGSSSGFGQSSYFRLVSQTPSVACISQSAREELLKLGAGDGQANVVPLGGDHLLKIKTLN